MEGVQKNFAERMAEVRAKLVPGTPVEVWIRDEIGLVRRTNSPIGQKGLTSARQPRSTHPVDLSVRRDMPAKRGAGLALALTAASSRRDRHQGHPPVATPFSSSIKPADMAQKDLHVPSSISLLPLPPRHAPSSTTRKTSGSSCVRTGCRTASSNLQRHRRSLLLRLEHPDRSVLENHVHRSSRFGRCRSLFARTDISLRTAPLTHSNPAKAVEGGSNRPG
jgi:hypothetical protein